MKKRFLCLSYKFINKKCDMTCILGKKERYDILYSDCELKSFLSLTNKHDFS